MTLEVWLLFSAAALLNIISPGPAILLSITNGVTSGLKMVLVSTAGNVLGLLILSTISILGLGLLLKTSVIFFTILKVLGAAYLIYLGIKKFRSKDAFLVEDSNQNVLNKAEYKKKFNEAFFVAITNPKAILFFVAFFPLFLDVNSPTTPQFLIMTLTFMTLSFMSLFTYGYIGKSAKHWFEKAKVVKVFHRVTGGIFIGFGVILLQTKN